MNQLRQCDDTRPHPNHQWRGATSGILICPGVSAEFQSPITREDLEQCPSGDAHEAHGWPNTRRTPPQMRWCPGHGVKRTYLDDRGLGMLNNLLWLFSRNHLTGCNCITCRGMSFEERQWLVQFRARKLSETRDRESPLK